MADSENNVYLVVNRASRSGRKQRRLKSILKTLRSLGIEPHLIDAPTAEKAKEEIKSALEKGATRIIVDGGDGSVHLVANEMAETDCVLGIIPGGSGNDFARANGLMRGSLKTKTIRAAKANLVSIDLMKNGSQYGTTVAIWNFPVEVNKLAERLPLPKRFSSARYTIATVLLAFSNAFKAHDIELKVGDEPHSGPTLFYAIGNTADFGNAKKICPEANPADGQLSVCIVGDVSRLEILRMLMKIKKAGHVNHPQVKFLSGATVTVNRDDEYRVDGEEFGRTLGQVDCVKGALKLAGAVPDFGISIAS